jgi:uncharacterized protein (DUF1684 family)
MPEQNIMKKTLLVLSLISLSAVALIFTKSISTIETFAKPEKSAEQLWQSWVQKYDKSRRSKDGWLSLVGLYWLNEGFNSIGSAENKQHRFPQETPGDFGHIIVDKEVVTFTRTSKEVKIDGQNIDSQVLILNKSIVSLGSYSFYIIKRERGFAIRLKNIDNPAITKFKGTRFYPYSDAWTIPARLIRHQMPQTINIATVYETIRKNDSAGWLEFEYEGKKIRLQAVSYGDEEPMSVMFADETSQETTYGAGRFLDVEWPKEGDVTVINFNRAYNPPCAITEFATCPLPPRQNRLDFSVTAGELFESH